MSSMVPQVKFPEPSSATADSAVLLSTYLNFYRSELSRRIGELDNQAHRATPLPSGWTPIELLNHLLCVERRWIVWGFQGYAIEDPWADEVDGVWHVPAGVSVPELLEQLDAVAAATTTVLATRGLDEQASTGGRFDGNNDLPTLAWTCFHVLQEYARHLGHLDIAVEVLGGPVGEDTT